MSFTDVVTIVGLKSTDSYNATNLINSERIKKHLNKKWKAVRKHWGYRDHYIVPYIKDITKLIISINGDDPSLC